MKVLDKPLTIKEIKKQYDETEFVQGIVCIDLGELINVCCAVGYEYFLDMLGELLVDSSLLMDIGYELVGAEGDYLLLKVDGDPSAILEESEND